MGFFLSVGVGRNLPSLCSAEMGHRGDAASRACTALDQDQEMPEGRDGVPGASQERGGGRHHSSWRKLTSMASLGCGWGVHTVIPPNHACHNQGECRGM